MSCSNIEISEKYDYENLPTTTEEGIKSIYIVDFAMRMLDKSNIPLFIYLIIIL